MHQASRTPPPCNGVRCGHMNLTCSARCTAATIGTELFLYYYYSYYSAAQSSLYFHKCRQAGEKKNIPVSL